MPFEEVDESKQVFYKCYKIIDNILSKGFWYCYCHEYCGCQTILNILKNDKRYCCVCQFQDEFSFFELHKIKRFRFYLRRYYRKILDRIKGMRPFYLEEQFFWSREIHYTVKNDYLNERNYYCLI